MAGRGSTTTGKRPSPEKQKKHQQNRPPRGTKHDPSATGGRSKATPASANIAASGGANTMSGIPGSPGSTHPDFVLPGTCDAAAATTGIGATGSPGSSRSPGSSKSPVSSKSPGAASDQGVSSSPLSGVSHPLLAFASSSPTKTGGSAPCLSPSAEGRPITVCSSSASPGIHDMGGSPLSAMSTPAAGSWRSPERRAKMDAARRAEVRGNLVPFVMSSVAGLSVLYFIWGRLSRAVLVTRPPESDVPMGNFSSWAAIGVKECSAVARRVFGEHGTVGDAAVALTLCSCVVLPMHCGPGGGMIALYYRKSTGKTWFIDGREMSPSAASKAFYKPGNSSVLGVLSIAVPGQMRGLGKLLELTGNNIPWRSLFKEAIELAVTGVTVSPEMARQFALNDYIIASDRALRAVFMPSGTTLKAGAVFRQAKMASTLKTLAYHGRSGYFYEEEYAKTWLGEITGIGSLMKMQDVQGYEARAVPAVTMELQDNVTLATSPPPTTGAITATIFGIVEQWYQHRELNDDASFLHVLVEAFKFGFGRRSWFGDYDVTDPKMMMTLTDREYTKGLADRIKQAGVLPHSQYADEYSADKSKGTAPILVAAPNGDVVVLVSSMNSLFGSAVMSELTGIIFNNVMNDFDISGQTNLWGFSAKRSLNELGPNRRPITSLAPVFLFQDGEFRAAAIGTGGGHAITGPAQVLLRVLKMKRTLKEAVDWYRVHHQLEPDTLFIESSIDYAKRLYLSGRSHNMETIYRWPGKVMALAQEHGRIYAMYDYRDEDTDSIIDGT